MEARWLDELRQMLVGLTLLLPDASGQDSGTARACTCTEIWLRAAESDLPFARTKRHRVPASRLPAACHGRFFPGARRAAEAQDPSLSHDGVC